MNVYTTIANVATKIKDIASPYKLEDSEIKARIVEAVKDYSKKRPMKKRYIVPVIADTDTYDLPTDFIHIIYGPTEDTWLSDDGKVRLTPSGIVPVSTNHELPEEYLIQGKKIQFVPMPKISDNWEMSYAAFHKSTGSGSAEDYTTIPVIDEDLIEQKTSTLCLETIVAQMARDNFKYTIDGTTIDKSGQAKEMREQIKVWNADYENRILRPVGIRS